jgi:hypothetical protein
MVRNQCLSQWISVLLQVSMPFAMHVCFATGADGRQNHGDIRAAERGRVGRPGCVFVVHMQWVMVRPRRTQQTGGSTSCTRQPEMVLQ